MNALIASTVGITCHGVHSCSMRSHGVMMPARHTTDPIERSMPPVTITNAAPSASTE